MHWTHPGNRGYLSNIKGSAVPGVLPRVWDNYMSTRIVPPQVEQWNSSHPAAELSGYNPTEAVDEAIQIHANE